MLLWGRMAKRNLYIVADGMGGAGKDLILAYLKQQFEGLKYRVVMTFEPGGTPEANSLRAELFARKEKGDISPEEELQYVFEARRMNMEQVVIPVLQNSELTVVLKARDYLSSFIYQVASGASREMLMEFYRKYYEESGFPKPDMRLLMILDAETAMKRRLGDGVGGDGFDLQPSAYWRAVEAGYFNEAMDISRGKGLFRQETVVIDARHDKSTVGEVAWNKIARAFELVVEEAEKKEGRSGHRGWYR